MATSIRMPRMGANMEEGTIVKWLKKEGDSVTKGEALLEIETDKVTVEVPAPGTGTLIKVGAQASAVVPVGEIIGAIGEAGEQASAGAAAPHKPNGAAAPAPQSAKAPTKEAATSNGSFGRVRISPYAKKLARELGVDVQALSGSGPSGRIVRADIERAAKAPAAPSGAKPATQELSPQGASRIRMVTATRMLQSLQTTAQLTLTMDADVTRADALRRELALEVGTDGPPITITAFAMKAAARALRLRPEMHMHWDGEGLQAYSDVNIGLAVALDEGLMVPVMRDVDKASLIDIASWIKGASDRARSSTLTADDMSTGTFTVSNLGATPVQYFTPILNPGEAGILGIGRSQKKAVVVDDAVAVRLILPLSLTWDHRILDGVPAARFAAVIKDLLENPLRLLAS